MQQDGVNFDSSGSAVSQRSPTQCGSRLLGYESSVIVVDQSMPKKSVQDSAVNLTQHSKKATKSKLEPRILVAVKEEETTSEPVEAVAPVASRSRKRRRAKQSSNMSWE
jgi:hypothetical protein